MRTRRWVPAVGGLLVLGALTGSGLAQQTGVAGKVGQKLDEVGRGLRREAQVVTEAVRRRFETVRNEVNQMGIPSRVYSRLHWDRALNASRIEVHLVRRGGILLRGTVPDQAARERAVALTRDTVDVNEVFDELSVHSTPDQAVAPAAFRRAR